MCRVEMNEKKFWNKGSAGILRRLPKTSNCCRSSSAQLIIPHNSHILRRSPIDNPYGDLNPKWIMYGTVSAFNRIPICEIHFGLQQRHNINMSILSSEDLFAERVFF